MEGLWGWVILLGGGGLAYIGCILALAQYLKRNRRKNYPRTHE